MNITIDQLITRLQEAKSIIGGDKVVYFWNSPGDDYVLSPSSFSNPIAGKLYTDKTAIGFEIDSLAP